MRTSRLLAFGIAMLLLAVQSLPMSVAPTTFAVAPGNAPFELTWARTDRPVAALAVERTWMWGPEAFTDLLTETYEETPGARRTVQYFDKSRMEITYPDGDQHSIWYVTNGLLVVELMSGRMQTGDDRFDRREPARVGVAGDPDDTTGPTYASLAPLRAMPPLQAGTTITQRVARDGSVSNDQALAQYGVTAAMRVTVPELDHQVASVFWAFMQSSGTIEEDSVFVDGPLFVNPFYATGLPITEAYWARVKVRNVEMDVLIQCFERRCLTYTPSNPDGWKVEAGNVGQHYHRWRYPTADSMSAFVPAASGGQFAFGDEVVVDIPPGALASDTTLTITRVPNDADLANQRLVPVGHSYDISIDAVEILAPVGLEVKYDPNRLPDGIGEPAIQLARRTPGVAGWTVVPSSAILNRDVVTAETTVLSRWTPVVEQPIPCVDDTATATITRMPAMVRVGQPLVYTVTLAANTCLDESGDTNITVLLPDTLTLTRIIECVGTRVETHVGCAYNRPLNRLTLAGEIAPNDTLTLRFEVMVPDSTDDVPNTIQVCADVDDGLIQGQVCTTVAIDLSVPEPNKVSDPQTVAAGDTFRYVVTFTGHPDGDGSGGVIDPLPEGVEFIDVACFTFTGRSSGLCAYDEEEGKVVVDLSTLARWDLIRVEITLQAAEDAEPDTIIQNCADVDDGLEVTTVCAETTIAAMDEGEEG